MMTTLIWELVRIVLIVIVWYIIEQLFEKNKKG